MSIAAKPATSEWAIHMFVVGHEFSIRAFRRFIHSKNTAKQPSKNEVLQNQMEHTHTHTHARRTLTHTRAHTHICVYIYISISILIYIYICINYEYDCHFFSIKASYHGAAYTVSGKQRITRSSESLTDCERTNLTWEKISRHSMEMKNPPPGIPKKKWKASRL